MVEHMVFGDESGVNTNLTRLYGRTLSSQRAVDYAPLNTPQMTTVLSSIHLNGENTFGTCIHGRWTPSGQAFCCPATLKNLEIHPVFLRFLPCRAAKSFVHPAFPAYEYRFLQRTRAGQQGKRFVQYLKETLLPTLKPGDIVVMNNMRSHHLKAVRELLEGTGMKALYLPPYSPDLHPIEKVWFKMKALLRGWKIRIGRPSLMRFAWPSLLFRHWTAAIGLPLPLIASSFDDCYKQAIAMMWASTRPSIFLWWLTWSIHPSAASIPPYKPFRNLADCVVWHDMLPFFSYVTPDSPVFHPTLTVFVRAWFCIFGPATFRPKHVVLAVLFITRW